jgi:hypothetical protein
MARGNLTFTVVLLATVDGSMALIPTDVGTARKSLRTHRMDHFDPAAELSPRQGSTIS